LSDYSTPLCFGFKILNEQGQKMRKIKEQRFKRIEQTHLLIYFTYLFVVIFRFEGRNLIYSYLASPKKNRTNKIKAFQNRIAREETKKGGRYASRPK
jgi:hypothetical protein